MYTISLFISGALSVFTLLCFIRIILTWIPGSEYTPVGRFFCSVCDPYLNLFRRFSFLRIGAFDFSPTVALLVLVGLSSVVSGIFSIAQITLSGILILIISLVWSLLRSILLFIVLIMAVRLIALLVSRDYSSSFWDLLDRTITPLIYRITGAFSKTTLPFKSALIISIVVLLLLTAGCGAMTNILVRILSHIPF